MAQIYAVTRGLQARPAEPGLSSSVPIQDRVRSALARVGDALGSWSVPLLEASADLAATVRAGLLVRAQSHPSPALDLNRSLLSVSFPLMIFDAVGTTCSGGAALLRSIKNGDTAGVIDALLQIPTGMIKFVTGGIFLVIAPLSAAVDIMEILQTSAAQLTRILDLLWIVASAVSALYFGIKVVVSSYRSVLCLKMLVEWMRSGPNEEQFLQTRLHTQAADVQGRLDAAGDETAQKSLLLERGCAGAIKRFEAAVAQGRETKAGLARLKELLAKLVAGTLTDDEGQRLQTIFNEASWSRLPHLEKELTKEGANKELLSDAGFHGLCLGDGVLNPILQVGLAEVALQVQGDKNARMDRVVGPKWRIKAQEAGNDLAAIRSALKKGLAIKLAINTAVIVGAITATLAMIGSIVTLGPSAMLAIAIMMVVYNVIFMAADGVTLYMLMEEGKKPTAVDKALVYISMGLAVTLMLAAMIIGFTVGLPMTALMATSITFSLWMTLDMMVLKWMAKQEKIAAEREGNKPILDKLDEMSQRSVPVASLRTARD